MLIYPFIYYNMARVYSVMDTFSHSLLPLLKQSIIKLKIATGTVVVKVEVSVSACNYCDSVYALVNTENM